MLKRIYIDNYKCFTNFEMTFDEFMVLLGRNGAGKSAILEVVGAVRSVLSGRPKINDRDAFPEHTLTAWSKNRLQVVEIDVETEATGRLTYSLEIEHAGDSERARIRSERLTAPGGPLFAFERGRVRLYNDQHEAGPEFGGDWTESWLARFTSHRDNPRPARFLDYVARQLVVSRPYPSAMHAESRDEEPSLAYDASNFAAWYRGMIQERPDLAQKLAEALADVFEDFHGMRMELVGKEARVLKAVFDHGGRYELRFDQLSDGQRGLVALYAMLYLGQERGRTLLLDEPDNYLAVSEIQPWLMAASDAVGENISQLLVCSHNAEVIDYMGTPHGRLLNRAGAGPVTVRSVAELAQQEGLRLSEILARGWE